MYTSVPKVCGADAELGNFILGADKSGGTASDASRLLLHNMPGTQMARSSVLDGKWIGLDSSQDWGRKFLSSNGGCAYVDLSHLEVCTPETTSAWQFTAAWHAMLRLVQDAQRKANLELTGNRKLQVLVNNSDGYGNSFGSHTNFLLTRNTWDNIFEKRLHYLLFLASYQASSVVFTGQGKVGSENGTALIPFQISQRADFIECMVGIQTTFNRPLVNRRDEPLCGPNQGGELARLHVIFYDSNLCHVANVLKVGVLQIVLSMIEAGRCSPELILDDPVGAVGRWSHDPSLRHKEAMASGDRLSAVELQKLFFEEAEHFVHEGNCDGLVDRPADILRLWGETLEALGRYEYATVAPRLDWVLKLTSLMRASQSRPDFTMDSPEARHLDQIYSSLDPEEGLYWAYESSGFAQRLLSDAEIARFVESPPDDTRAWTRAMLLRRASQSELLSVDWDYIRFQFEDGTRFPRKIKVAMNNPLSATRAHSEAAFSESDRIEDILGHLARASAAVNDADVPLARETRVAPAGAGKKGVEENEAEKQV